MGVLQAAGPSCAFAMSAGASAPAPPLARMPAPHRRLVRHTLAGRTLLDALPMPAWLRGADGRLQWVNEAYVKAVEAGSEAEVRERQIELLEMRQREAVGAALLKAVAYRERVHLI